MTRILLAIITLFLFNQFSYSQSKSPNEFLGYELGSRFSRHHQVVDYFEHVSNSNENVKLIKYGETYEKRSLNLAIVTSPNNFSKLEEIRSNQLRSARLIDGDPGERNRGAFTEVIRIVLLQ